MMDYSRRIVGYARTRQEIKESARVNDVQFNTGYPTMTSKLDKSLTPQATYYGPSPCAAIQAAAAGHSALVKVKTGPYCQRI